MNKSGLWWTHFAMGCLFCAFLAPADATSASDAAAVHRPEAGLLYFASWSYRDRLEPIQNPNLAGALFWVHWSAVEKARGVYDWSELDSLIQPWIEAGKSVALRIMWSGSGSWGSPLAKRPTPEWVWKEGAKMAYSQAFDTEVPLQWDPIYRQYAFQFLDAMARKYDGNPNILFIDISPGGETNPYRGNLGVADPSFRSLFENTAASDGRKYSDELWLQTVKEYVDFSSKTFQKTPLLVTLNFGRAHERWDLDKAPDNFREIGDYCVERGMFVGQNGLAATSYLESNVRNDLERRRAFEGWAPKTHFYFEMVHSTDDPDTGPFMGVMDAAGRIRCNYLGVSAIDALRGTKGAPEYDAEYETTLEYGASIMDGGKRQPEQTN